MGKSGSKEANTVVKPEDEHQLQQLTPEEMEQKEKETEKKPLIELPGLLNVPGLGGVGNLFDEPKPRDPDVDLFMGALKEFLQEMGIGTVEVDLTVYKKYYSQKDLDMEFLPHNFTTKPKSNYFEFMVLYGILAGSVFLYQTISLLFNDYYVTGIVFQIYMFICPLLYSALISHIDYGTGLINDIRFFKLQVKYFSLLKN